MDTPKPKQYRFKATYRQWRSKPDPSGFGRYEVYSDDYSWLQEKMQRDSKNGHLVRCVQKLQADGSYKTI